MKSLYENTLDLLEAIEDCLTKRRLLPCLALLYSGIDVFASLEARQGEGTRVAFVNWCEKYLLKMRPLKCSALDLYAARCGVVHTFTPESDLYRSGHAWRIAYAWGGAQADDLAAASTIIGKADVLAIHIRDLVDAFRYAIAEYLESVSSDPQWRERVKAKTSLWFVNMDQADIKKLLELHHAGATGHKG